MALAPRKWRRLAQLLSENPIHIALLVGLALATGVAEVLLMLIVTRLALNASSGADAFDLTRNWTVSVSEALILGVVVLLARFGVSMLAVRVRAGLNYRVVNSQRMRLAERFITANRLQQLNEPSGTLQKVVADFPTRGGLLLSQTTLSLASTISLITVVVSALVIDPPALVFMLGGLIVISLVLGPLKGLVGRRSKEAVNEQIQFANELGEIDGVALEVKVFGVESEVLSRVRTLVGRDSSSQMRLSLTSGLMSPIYSLLAYALILIAVSSVSQFDFLNVDSFTAVVLIMIRAFSYGQDVQNGFVALEEFVPYIDSMDDFESRLTRSGPVAPRPTSNDKVDEVRMESVEFAYPGREPILSGFDLELVRGQAIGIIGTSGSGKTTLIQILLGLIEPRQGRFFLNSQEVSFDEYRQRIRILSFVPQVAQLFAGSIRENILFFRQEPQAGRLEDVVSKSMLDRDLSQMPMGLDTPIGPSGHQLSGGQRQRIAIARALLDQPHFLVLDEPTSALDTETQSGILETLQDLKHEVGLVVVTHSAHLAPLFDTTIELTGRTEDDPGYKSKNSDFGDIGNSIDSM